MALLTRQPRGLSLPRPQPGLTANSIFLGSAGGFSLDGRALTKAGGITAGLRDGNYGFQGDTSDNIASVTSRRSIALSTDLLHTWVVVFRKQSSSADTGSICGYGASGGSSGNTLFRILGAASADAISFNLRDSAGSEFYMLSSTGLVKLSDTKYHCAVIAVNAASGGTAEIYIDGRLDGTATSPGSPAATTFESASVCGIIRAGAALAFGGFDVALFAPFLGKAGDEWCKSVSKNPWQLFPSWDKPVLYVPNTGSIASISGTSDGTVVGASLAASTGSVAGTSDGVVVGASLAATTLASAGVGALTGQSGTIATIAGTGTATGIGASLAASVLSSVGVAAIAFVGQTPGSDAAISGTATVSGVGSSTAVSTYSTAGAGAVTGVGVALSPSVFSVSGTSEVLAIVPSAAASFAITNACRLAAIDANANIPHFDACTVGDEVTGLNVSSSDSFTQAHTIGSFDDTVLAVFVLNSNWSGKTIPTVTYGGFTLTHVPDAYPAGADTILTFVGAADSSGGPDVEITSPNGFNGGVASAVCVSYYNVHQTTPVDAAVGEPSVGLLGTVDLDITTETPYSTVVSLVWNLAGGGDNISQVPLAQRVDGYVELASGPTEVYVHSLGPVASPSTVTLEWTGDYLNPLSLDRVAVALRSPEEASLFTLQGSGIATFVGGSVIPAALTASGISAFGGIAAGTAQAVASLAGSSSLTAFVNVIAAAAGVGSLTGVGVGAGVGAFSVSGVASSSLLAAAAGMRGFTLLGTSDAAFISAAVSAQPFSIPCISTALFRTTRPPLRAAVGATAFLN